LGCWAKVADSRRKKAKKMKTSLAKQSLERATQLFQQMCEKGHVSTRAYNIMLNVYAKAGRTKEAEKVFRNMIVGYQSGNSAVRPNRISVNTLLGAFSRWGHNNCGDRAIAVMEEYERLYKEGTILHPPDVVTYNNVIHCLAVAGQPERAEELLHKMKATREVGGASIMPDRISWNTVIDGYARAKNPRRAEELLEMMYQEYLALEGKNSHMKPDIKTFCTVLNAWRSSGEAGSGDRANAILKTMHGLSNSRILNVEPNTIAYNIVLACWAKSQDREAPWKAEQVLDTMEDLFHKGSSTVRPDGVAYWSVLSAYANRGQARHAERILERHHQQSLPAAMGGGGNTQESPNAVSYNKVLGAFKRSDKHDSAQRAEDLWKRWQKRFENGELSFPTTPQSVQLVLETWEAAARRPSRPYDQAAIRAKEFLRYVTENYQGEGFPDTAAHNIVLHMFGLQTCLDSAAALEYFWFMAHKDSKHEKPNVESLKLVLSAIKASRPKDAAEQVENLIRKVTESDQLDIEPDLECYRILLNCLEDDRTLQSAQKADSILHEMEENPNLTPDGQDYIQVVRLWTKVNNEEAVFNADTNFRLMKRRYYGGDESMKPSVSAFRTVIKSWERSDHVNKAESIQGLKAEMMFLFGEEALEPANKEK
jgi:pentatricopeptide repeat protein